MGDDFLGISRGQQIAIIGTLGVVVLAYGLTASSSVDAEYDPLAFGIGLVMCLYALGAAAYDGYDRFT